VNFLPGLASNHNPSDLLPSSWDYKYEPLCPARAPDKTTQLNLTTLALKKKNWGLMEWLNWQSACLASVRIN
jgi:hypothetical protein